ncbi:MAG: class I SAM-dependent methyltransferase [Rhodoferax sp.]|jgi:2-polyprenyl-3-methyl-5-hydroxy-6-metoxy-1,4-benzoquinol methylase|nr:class I SAM-dependent methyltransferase [Rhodoferax sp.]
MQSYSEKSDAYFAHARKEIAPMLPHDCGRVLELGCGSGATLAWLQQTGRAAYTAGVEISELAAQVARQHVGEVHCADMERTEVSFAGGKFDLVLCLDVLEHLVDPWAMVDRLVRQQLVPGGTIIVSVPNIRHFKVLLPLVFQGRWDYTEAGHLDRTHLRFFTRRSAIALLSHRHLSVPECHDTGFEGWSRKNLLNTLTLGLFRDFVTYQFFLVAQKLD